MERRLVPRLFINKQFEVEFVWCKDILLWDIHSYTQAGEQQTKKQEMTIDYITVTNDKRPWAEKMTMCRQISRADLHD